MFNGWKLAMAIKAGRIGLLTGALVVAGAWSAGVAQEAKAAADGDKTHEVYKPIPGFDTSSIDKSVDPCNDFYKFACGKFAANHPIPADQPEVDQFYALYNVNTQALNGILNKAAAGGAGVDRAIEILRDDLYRTLRLLGCPSVAALDRSYVNVPKSWEWC